MKLIRNAFAIGTLAAAALVACSGSHGSTSTGSGGTTNVASVNGQGGDNGTIKMHLTVAPGDNLLALTYTCTGPSVIPSNTVNFGDAQSIEFDLGGITAGNGYQCVLTGTDTNGDPCTGTTTLFNVVAGQVSGASVLVTCTVPTDASFGADVNTGTVGFDAGVQVVNQNANSCPGITAFSIVPSEVIGNQPAQLTINETGPIGLASDGGATTSDVIWTASCGTPPCGTFGPSATASAPTFTCLQPNEQVVTITGQVTNYETSISTGIVSDVCAGKPFTTYTATIDCEGTGVALSCALSDSAHPTSCPGSDGGVVCTNTNLAPVDPANCGACGVSCTAPQTCTHNSGTNTNSCTNPPPGGPCVQLVGGVPADSIGNTSCVKCDKNTNNLCTGTEAIIVTRDIEKGLVSANAPTAASCYECMVASDNLDSTKHVPVQSGLECETGGVDNVQNCLNTVNCIFGSPENGTAGTGGTNSGATSSQLAADCSNASDGVYNCFCGSAEPDTDNCGKSNTVASMTPPGTPGTSSPNGSCLAQVFAGTGDTASTSNSQILFTDLADTTKAAGFAFQISINAGSNQAAGQACPVCFQ
jgi:hypothetical protein